MLLSSVIVLSVQFSEFDKCFFYGQYCMFDIIPVIKMYFFGIIRVPFVLIWSFYDIDSDKGSAIFKVLTCRNQCLHCLCLGNTITSCYAGYDEIHLSHHFVSYWIEIFRLQEQRPMVSIKLITNSIDGNIHIIIMCI